MVGSIAKAAVAAHQRSNAGPDAVSFGGEAGASEHLLCGPSTWVPAATSSVKGRKYQPSTAENEDFQTGDDSSGWKCLRFAVTHPISYQLRYCHPTATQPCSDFTNTLSADSFVAQAQGDTDADGIPARFQRSGSATADGVTMRTELWMQNDTE
jgi:type IV pilus assembly protein PilA